MCLGVCSYITIIKSYIFYFHFWLILWLCALFIAKCSTFILHKHHKATTNQGGWKKGLRYTAYQTRRLLSCIFNVNLLIFTSMYIGHKLLICTAFPPRRPGFETRSGHVGFVVDKVALGQVFSEYFGFLWQFSFHRMLHIHIIIYHPGLVQ
jgi:hypothetical protein